MSDELKVNNSTLRLQKGDITDFEIDSFVYYARNDLMLGSGFGTAISVRGGPSIQEELKTLAPIDTTKAIISAAGEMKAKYIIHAVGPKFQEENLEDKLKETIINALKEADKKEIPAVAFPPMGAGFYGVPLPVSADITLKTIADYLKGVTKIKDVVICLLDNRDYAPFKSKLADIGKA